MQTGIETCANCGEKIGRLETPHLYRDQVVCARCIAKLQPQPPDLPAVEDAGVDEALRQQIAVEAGAMIQTPAGDLIDLSGDADDGLSYNYGSIQLSPSLLRIGSSSYAVPNLASVTLTQTVTPGQFGAAGIAIAALGGLILLSAFLLGDVRGHGAAESRAMAKWFWLTGGALLAWGVVAFLRGRTPELTTYHVIVTANSGERHVIDVPSRRHANELRSRIERVIRLSRQQR